MSGKYKKKGFKSGWKPSLPWPELSGGRNATRKGAVPEAGVPLRGTGRWGSNSGPCTPWVGQLQRRPRHRGPSRPEVCSNSGVVDPLSENVYAHFPRQTPGGARGPQGRRGERAGAPAAGSVWSTVGSGPRSVRSHRGWGTPGPRARCPALEERTEGGDASAQTRPLAGLAGEPTAAASTHVVPHVMHPAQLGTPQAAGGYLKTFFFPHYLMQYILYSKTGNAKPVHGPALQTSPSELQHAQRPGPGPQRPAHGSPSDRFSVPDCLDL